MGVGSVAGDAVLGTNLGNGAVSSVVSSVSGEGTFAAASTAATLFCGGDGCSGCGSIAATLAAIVCTSAIAPHPTSPQASVLEIGATCEYPQLSNVFKLDAVTG